jgi:hypothetical protein
MAQRNYFEYVNPDTGRKEFECPALQGQSILANQIVNAVDATGYDVDVLRATMWAALCADVKGHKVLPRGVKRTTNVSEFIQKMAEAVESGYVIDFADRYNVLFNRDQVSDDDNGDVDENPTGTSLAFS